MEIHLEADGGQRFECVPVRLHEGRSVGVQQRVGEIIEASRGGYGGVEHAQRTGGGVARIHESQLFGGQALGVEALEGAAGHDHFAAHFECVRHAGGGRRRGVDRQGQRTDSSGVGGDDLAGHAVAAGETDGEAASAVAHRHRDAVELEFADVNEGFDSGQLARAAVEVPQLLFVESVVEAEHCRGVLGFLRSRARRAADPLRRGFRGDQLGIRVLERLQALDQAVVLGVGYLGLVEDVIEMLVTANLCAQCFDLPDGGAARCLRGRFGRASPLL